MDKLIKEEKTAALFFKHFLKRSSVEEVFSSFSLARWAPGKILFLHIFFTRLTEMNFPHDCECADTDVLKRLSSSKDLPEDYAEAAHREKWQNN